MNKFENLVLYGIWLCLKMIMKDKWISGSDVIIWQSKVADYMKLPKEDLSF